MTDQKKKDPLLGAIEALTGAIDELRLELKAARDADEPSLEMQLRSAADWWHDEPALSKTRGVSDLIRDGFSLKNDILPVVRAYANKPSDRHNWEYFVQIIRTGEHNRLANGKVTMTAQKREAYKAKVYVILKSDAGRAWTEHFVKTTGKTPPQDFNGGWWFDSEWPPQIDVPVEG